MNMLNVVKPMQLFHSERVLEHNREYYWTLTSGCYIKLNTGSIIMEHDAIKNALEAMGESALPDCGMPKPHGEYLVSGNFHAPSGQSVKGGQVRVELSVTHQQPQRKTLNVFGNRRWVAGIPSSPEPLSSLPILYTRSYGGKDYSYNPIGLGYQGSELPNIEVDNQTTESNKGQYMPAGFGPLDVMWPQRAQYQGTYDEHYMQKYFPGFPKDTDWRLFMSAPQDQWHTEYYQGNESFKLVNWHPDKQRIEGVLPRYRIRAFTHDKTNSDQFSELKMQLDTIWFFPEHEMAQLIWRGTKKVQSDDISEFTHVLLGLEQAEERKAKEYYFNALDDRIQNPDPLKNTLNTDDLIPSTMKSAMALLMDSAIEEAEPSALSKNMGAKSENLKSAAESEISKQILKAQDAIKKSDVDENEKTKLLSALNTKPDVDQELHSLSKKIDAILPGVTSGNPKQIDFTKISFSKMDDLMKSVSEFGEKKKSDTLEKLKPDIEGLKIQLKSKLNSENSGLNEAELNKLNQQIKSLDSLTQESEIQPEVPLPRFDEKPIIESVKKSSKQIEQAEKELHILIMQGISAESKSILDKKDKLAQMRGSLEEQVKDALAEAKKGFLSGYGMAAHFSPNGKSPHKNTEQRQLEFQRRLKVEDTLNGEDWACLYLSGIHIKNADFSDCLMEQIDLTGVTFTDCQFTNTVLARANFSRSKFINCKFSNSNLGASTIKNCHFESCQFEDCIFSKSTIEGTEFYGTRIADPQWMEVVLNKSYFESCSISGLLFVEIGLHEVDFKHSQFDRCSFMQSGLTKITFTHCRLPNTAWANTMLDQVSFYYCNMDSNCFAVTEDSVSIKKIEFVSSSLVGANFQNLNLNFTNFTESNLSRVNFSKSNLQYTNFTRSNLSYGNLRKADLAHALLSSANLTNVILSHAKLIECDFQGSNLYSSDFIRATINHCNFKGANLDRTILEEWRPS